MAVLIFFSHIVVQLHWHFLHETIKIYNFTYFLMSLCLIKIGYFSGADMAQEKQF